MALATKLQLRQSQQLVMTPQLQQAIRLLQLSNLELNAFVDAELERNPLLERDDDHGALLVPAAPDSGREEALVEYDAAPPALDLSRQSMTATRDLDADPEAAFPESSVQDLGPGLTGSSWANLRQSHGQAGDGDNGLEDYLAGEQTLRDHLTKQLELTIVDPVDRLIGANLIDLVDDAGYLRAELDEIAERLGTPLDRVEKVLSTLHGFDPAGVCARDLRECLTLQLRERGRYDPMIAKLLDALPLLASHNLAALRRAVGADAEDLADMIAEIKRLDPKPGLRFGRDPIEAVVPDVIVRPSSDGGWTVEVNSENLPRVLVNRTYYARVSSKAQTEKDRDYLIDCLQTANWLVKSLDQRARTILKVATEIVRMQDAFFARGVQYMRPLNLKTIADAIKMHESTVSRVTSNKYLATPRGIFEMKYFFTSAIAAVEDGEAHSSEAVRHRIKALIENEKTSSVLSDDRLVELLEREGIEIARRTVAKYREALRIPSSVQRRREKRQIA